MKIAEITSLTDKELLGQLLCPDISDKHSIEEKKKEILLNKPGAIFVSNMPREEIKELTDYANSVCKYPIMVVGDVEFGPGSCISGEERLPTPMAWGACDDDKLIERAGELTGEIMRYNGFHMSFSPVADINVNFRNPLVNTRSVSDSPKQVAKIASAYMRGMQKAGLLATVKHFPGDGVDDRNQHFCTTVNSLSQEEWMNSFGYVYKKMIDDGASAFMVAHIACPAFDKNKNYDVTGPLPATLNKDLTTGLLKEKLHFDGCAVSDAMSMIGSASLVPIEKLATKFIQSGGDMVLFPEKDDLNNLYNALLSGELKKERVLDAVNRVIQLKKRAKLFDDEPPVCDIERAREEIVEISNKIADKSVKIVRNANAVLPLSLNKGDKVLVINLYLDLDKSFLRQGDLPYFVEELQNRGLTVDVYHKISHYKIHEILNDYKAVFINSAIDCTSCRGSDMNIGWTDGIMTFWRAYVLQHKNVVFTSFGDPYKLYHFPYLKTYVNAFSQAESTQRSAVKVLLGEIPCLAKNPVGLEGFFQRETD